MQIWADNGTSVSHDISNNVVNGDDDGDDDCIEKDDVVAAVGDDVYCDADHVEED